MPTKSKSSKSSPWNRRIGSNQWLTMNEIKNFLDRIIEDTVPPVSFSDIKNPFKTLGEFHITAKNLKLKADTFYPEDTRRF